MKSAYEIAWKILNERKRLAFLTDSDIAKLTGLDTQVVKRMSMKKELATAIALNGRQLAKDVIKEIEDGTPHYRDEEIKELWGGKDERYE